MSDCHVKQQTSAINSIKCEFVKHDCLIGIHYLQSKEQMFRQLFNNMKLVLPWEKR